MPRDKKKREECRGAPEYMLTYGDMVTLLLCFFVLLLTMSTIHAEKVRMTLSAFRGAIGVMEKGPSVTKEDLMTMGMDVGGMIKGIPTIMTGKEHELGRREREDISDKIQAVLKEDVRKGAIKIRHEERGIVIQLTDKVLFDEGSAEIREEAKPVLDKVIELLERRTNRIQIEGHTDSTPIKTNRFLSNWELSTARATQVLRYFEDSHRIKSQRLSASGYGEYRPLLPNTTAKNRALNRRVDIVILREEIK
ncbi:MAG: OmpA family protein [bacterium]|nr:OmpA family protein [bacterium]